MAFTTWTDSFDNASLNATYFGTSTKGSGTVVEASGVLTIDAPATADAAAVYVKTAINGSNWQVYEATCTPSNQGSGQQIFLMAVSDGTTNITGNNANVNADRRFGIRLIEGSGIIRFGYQNTGGTWYYWDEYTGWGTAVPTTEGTAVEGEMVARIYIDPNGGSPRICGEVVYRGGTRIASRSGWVALSALKSYTTLYVSAGEIYDNYWQGKIVWDSFTYRQETVGPERIGFYNGSPVRGVSEYAINKAIRLGPDYWCHRDIDPVIEKPAGFSNIKDAFPVDVSGTLYLFYGALHIATGLWQVGYQTSTDDGESFTDQGIILSASGTGWRQNGCRFPAAYYDSGTWRIYCGGTDASNDLSVGYFSGANLASLSEGGSNPVIPVGVDAWNDGGYLAVDIAVSGGTKTLYVGGLNTSTAKWTCSEFTSTAWDSGFTGDAGNPTIDRNLSALTTLSGAVAAGATSVTVADASAFAVGDPVWLRYAIDVAYSESNRIAGISGSTITLEYPLTYAKSNADEFIGYDYGSLLWGETSGGSSIVTAFQMVAGSLVETTARYDLVGGTWTYDPTETPIIPLGSDSFGRASVENFRLVGDFGGIPNAPTSPSLSATTDTMYFTWTDNSTNEDYFDIARSFDGGAYSIVATVTVGATGYTDSSLSNGTYGYKVRATNDSGSSAYTTAVTGTIDVALDPTSKRWFALGL